MLVYFLEQNPVSNNANKAQDSSSSDDDSDEEDPSKIDW